MQTVTVISVNNLEKSFKNVKVLDKISFDVQKGSVFALLGSNGAGKTTTIKILTTLLRPDKGSARLCGFDVVREPGRVRREISLTGQFAAVDDVLTGRENLRMIGKLRHLPDINKKADELLKRFDLQDAADRRVATYSGGMRRRLDLSMSLLGSPSIIFLDEPTTGLDPQSRLAMWDIITNLAASGTTIFLTTQHLEEAEQLAHRICILNKGKLVASGTASELKKMLPNGHIELAFRDEKSMKLAYDLFGKYRVSYDRENLKLSVETDGSIEHITEILNRLKNANIPVAELTQKQPTLEDVYLSIVGEKNEKENEHANHN